MSFPTIRKFGKDLTPEEAERLSHGGHPIQPDREYQFLDVSQMTPELWHELQKDLAPRTIPYAEFIRRHQQAKRGL